MAVTKITEKTVASTLKDNAHVLITQPENVNGSMVESLRRVPVSVVEDAITDKSVKYNSAQTLTDAQKEQARGNIGAASEGEVTDLKSHFTTLQESFTIASPSKNLYDKNSCNPEDGYIYNNTYGNKVESSSYAITGKIPVDAETQYIFSCGGLATIRNVYFFGGSGGETYLSYEAIYGASFTTPENCTYIGIALFATGHTTEQFNAAIDVSQLERGNEATPYVPYGSSSYSFTLPAMMNDEGKPLTPKTVANGQVVEWEYKEMTSVVVDDTLTQSGEAADAKATGDIINGLATVVYGKNLYDKNACNPQNGKQYNTYGELVDSEKNAVTGKIPVEPNTQYIFSIGGIGKVKSAYYYSGTTGDTLISKETLDNSAFTTPATATFVGLTLFAATHTEQNYLDAIAVAQLEKGSVATPYEPYAAPTRKVKTDRLVDGQAVEGAKNYTITRSLVNLYDKTLAMDGKMCNSSHNIADNANYSFSGLIPVQPNTQYCYSKDLSVNAGSLSGTYQEWNINKEYIQSSSGPYATTHINQAITGANTHYISFNITYSGSHTTEEFNALIDTLMLCEGTQRPFAYFAYNVEPVVNHQKFDDEYSANADRFRGKRWLVCGTSVSYQDSKVYTEGVAEGELVRGYIGDIARRKAMLVYNQAVSGSTLAGTDANSLINTYQNYTYTDYDFMTIEYGINDFGNNVVVGTASDPAGTGSFAACLKTVIEYVLTQNPIIGLIICTDPSVRYSTNGNGNTLQDYMDVMIDIAKQYRLPVCDWFYRSGINNITRGDGSSRYYLTQAGTHPSVYGHMRMGAMLNQVFDSLLC